jgi:hypothetical protein
MGDPHLSNITKLGEKKNTETKARWYEMSLNSLLEFS